MSMLKAGGGGRMGGSLDLVAIQLNNFDEFHIQWVTLSQNSEGARKMAQQGTTLALKTDNLGWLCGIHMAKGENKHLQIVFWPPHAAASEQMKLIAIFIRNKMWKNN